MLKWQTTLRKINTEKINCDFFKHKEHDNLNIIALMLNYIVLKRLALILCVLERTACF